MRYALELAYDGTNYCGWQNQPNAISIQQTIEESMATILREKIEIVGCGRTDAGVHAQQYFAHFDTNKELPNNFLYNLNSLLGKNIAIKNIQPTHESWHARFDAKKRKYQYHIHQTKNPFLENYSFLFAAELDIDLMNKVAHNLMGTNDCSSFEKKGSDNQNSMCTITEAKFSQQNDNLVFTIGANRFLRNMVRAITASLLMIGTKQIAEDEWLALFQNKQNIPLKIVVPAKGLYLYQIEY